MTTTAESIRAAADHIEKHGLHKGQMFADGVFRWSEQAAAEVPKLGVPCCTVGALHAFGVNNDEARKAVALAAGPGILDKWDFDHIPEWNDAEERTADEVVAVLRKAADALEGGRA